MSHIEFDLARLRRHQPPPVDVADRVMQRIAVLPQPSIAPHARTRRPAAIAAALAAFVTAGTIVAGWVAAWPALGGGPLAALAVLRGVGGSATTASSLTRGFAGMLELAASIVRTIVSAFEPLRPAATTASFVMVAITLATVVLIVARDFSRARELEEI